MIESMLAGFFAINVKPEHREAFVEAGVAVAKGVIGGDPGAFQFQMLVDAADPNRFYFFEIYRDEAAGKAHMESEVFRTWWNTVEPMLDQGVETVATMHTVFPSVGGLEAQKAGLSNW
ncbi:putative quinol monooxygenase [Ruegeria sediminis]|nr:putative quinol monooxygenase [Ruegeria sediminis]